MTTGSSDDKKTKTMNRLGYIIITSILLMCLCSIVVYMITYNIVIEDTTKHYEAKIENLKKNHKTELNDTIEIYEKARTEHKRQMEHSERLAELAREQDKAIRFQMALTSAIAELQPKLDRKTADRISSEIVFECKEKGLDPILVTALIWIESRFDPMAHSNKGAVGLMQVRYSIWKENPIIKDNGVNTKHKLYWIDLNIKCGTDILAKYYKEADQDVVRSLYRYNTGNRDLPDKVDDFEVEYVNKILITAYKISDSIRKGNDDLLINH